MWYGRDTNYQNEYITMVWVISKAVAALALGDIKIVNEHCINCSDLYMYKPICSGMYVGMQGTGILYLCIYVYMYAYSYVCMYV